MATITDRIRAIANPKRRGSDRLPPVADKSAIPGGIGVGDRDLGVDGSGGFGDFVEIPDKREHHPYHAFRSTDGLFVIVLRSIKETQFIVAGGDVVTVEYVDDET